MELYILLLIFLAAVSGVVCQQAGNLNEMSALVSVLGEKPEHTALVDAIREIDTLQESGVPKKKITAALNALIKQVAFVKKYSSDADLDLVLVWCAARKGKSVAPSKNLSSSAAAYNGRSADDLALALSERPEYAELFELFVTAQVMIAQQSPLKKIRPHVFKLIERIQFVQKYASDEVLDEVMSWCYAQKGCSKRVMAGWKKALIGMAAAVFVVGLGVGVHKARARRHGNGAHPDNGGVHDAAFAGGPGHHGAFDGLAPHGGFYAAHAGGGGGGAPGPGVVGEGAPGAGSVGPGTGGGGGIITVQRPLISGIGSCSFIKHEGQCYRVNYRWLDGTDWKYNLIPVYESIIRARLQNVPDWTLIPNYKVLFLDYGEIGGFGDELDRDDGRWRVISHLNGPFLYRTRIVERVGGVTTAPVGPPARAIEAATGLSVEVQAAVIAQITTAGAGNNECPICTDSLLDAGTVLVCKSCKNVVGHLEKSDCPIQKENTCPLCRAEGLIVPWTPPQGLELRPAATTGGGTAGATAGAGSGAGVVGGVGAGSDGGAAGAVAGEGPAVLEIVNGVKKLRVSPGMSILEAKGAGLLPPGYSAANTLVRFGNSVAYIFSAQEYQVLPLDVVVGPITEYKVSNSRVTAPPGYTKVASFKAADDDEVFIYRQNALTS